jgi:hypothetical protein
MFTAYLCRQLSNSRNVSEIAREGESSETGFGESSRPIARLIGTAIHEQ